MTVTVRRFQKVMRTCASLAKKVMCGCRQGMFVWQGFQIIMGRVLVEIILIIFSIPEIIKPFLQLLYRVSLIVFVLDKLLLGLFQTSCYCRAKLGQL